MTVTTNSLEAFARELANNWASFESFCWHDEPEDSEAWAIINTHNRDSGLLEQSNASVIEKELEKFGDDVVSMRSSHWGFGWVDGFAVRIYKNGSITKACEKLYELQQALVNYPCLDESDYSQREYDAALENIESRSKYTIEKPPADWASQVFSWLWDNEQRELENTDDQGPYPSDKAIKTALWNLDLLDNEYWPEMALLCKVCGCFVDEPSQGIYQGGEKLATPIHSPIPNEDGFALSCEEGGAACLGSGAEGTMVEVE